jgi:serine protease
VKSAPATGGLPYTIYYGNMHSQTNHSDGGIDNIARTYSVNLSTETINGTWKLRVNDNASADVGYINSWNVTL